MVLKPYKFCYFYHLTVINIVKSSAISQPFDVEEVGPDFRVINPFGLYIRFTGLVDWGQ